MQKAKINIAIDGYSSCGKGTLARYLATQLGYQFIDSGAMYRAVTYYALLKKCHPENETEVLSLLDQINLSFEKNQATDRFDIVLNGENIEGKIRNLEVAKWVSPVARISGVRSFLVKQQQSIAAQKGVVMDGRDIGTVVLADAELKIFMTARPEIRAQRRLKELVDSGMEVTFEAVLQNLNERDLIDSTRADSPLLLTEAYHLLDNSDLSVTEQNALAMTWVKEALQKLPG